MSTKKDKGGTVSQGAKFVMAKNAYGAGGPYDANIIDLQPDFSGAMSVGFFTLMPSGNVSATDEEVTDGE